MKITVRPSRELSSQWLPAIMDAFLSRLHWPCLGFSRIVREVRRRSPPHREEGRLFQHPGVVQFESRPCLQERLRGERFSRHWHDIVRLDDIGIADKAADRTPIDYEAAVGGGLQLTPSGEGKKTWIAVAFSQNVRSACMTRGFAVGNSMPSTRPAASHEMSRTLAGSPVDRAPNSSMTLGAT